MSGVRASRPGALPSTLRRQTFCRSTDSTEARPRSARSKPPELRLGIGRDCGGTPAPGEARADADREGRGPTSQRPCSAASAPPFRQHSAVGSNSVAPAGSFSTSGSRGRRSARERSVPPRTQVTPLSSKPQPSLQRGGGRQGAGHKAEPARPPSPPQSGWGSGPEFLP